MNIPEKYLLSFNLPPTEVAEALDFQGLPVLTVDVNSQGFKYLSYLVRYTDDGFEQRLLIPLSQERLSDIKSGNMPVKDAFDKSEPGQVYSVFFDKENGEAIKTYLLPLDYFVAVNPIEDDYKINALACF